MGKKFPSEFATPEQSPGFLLWQVTNLWQRKQRSALAVLGLTHVQFVLLAGTFWLESNHEKVTQARLSKQVCVDRMMTSQVVRTLESHQFIQRLRDPSDSRAILLSVTEEGKKLVTKALKVVEKVDRDFFKSIGNQQELICSVLLKLLQRAEEHD